MYQSISQIETFFSDRRTLGIKPGLERMAKILKLHHNPERQVKTIHIAGTNGKGSTLTFIKAALIKNNYRVGAFISPSLSGITGHILINNNAIKDDQFISLFNQLLPTIDQLDSEGLHPTEFEIITAIAFLFFKNNVDIALIEAGMGGREDSTNCIHPILSIITNIAKDHANFLGSSLEDIAYQKAGIIKENVPTIIGKMDNTCASIVYEEAKKKQSIVYQLDKDFYCEQVSLKEESQTVKWSANGKSYIFDIQMVGIHQVRNVGLAIMALREWEKNYIELDWELVVSALKHAQIPGRFEKIKEKPLVILDGAHNPDGMKAFLETVQERFESERKTLVFAGFHDKELHKMLQMALPYFDTIVVTTFNHPRAEKPENILVGIHSQKIITLNLEDIMGKINQQNDACFFVGSLYFIQIMRRFLKDY